MGTPQRWSVLALAAVLATACSEPRAVSGPADTSPPALAAGSQATIGVNVLLNTAITDAIGAELEQFGHLRGQLSEINAVFLLTRSENLAAIRALPFVTDANPDAERNAGPSDPIAAEDFAGGWGTFDLDALNVVLDGETTDRAISYDGAGIYVAILDVGLMTTWRAYFPEERIATEFARSFGGGGIAGINVSTQPNKWEHSTNPHGLHVTSGVIGYRYQATPPYTVPFPREVNGVAPMATVIPVKVLNQNGYGWSSVITAGVLYIADLKASGALGSAPVVINMSLGGGNPDVVERAAIDYALSQGVIIVASAGNNGDWGMGYPGAYEPVISVGATGFAQQWTACDAFGQTWGVREWWWACDVPEPTNPDDFFVPAWSSRALAGQDLDVLAPGQWVRGPWQWDSHFVLYGYSYGTSFASPRVAGIVALMAQKYPALSASEAESILETSAIPMPPGSRTFLWLPGATVTHSWGANATGHGLATADAALAATP